MKILLLFSATLYLDYISEKVEGKLVYVLLHYIYLTGEVTGYIIL